MQAVGSGGSISAVIEVDNAALKRADWFTGGSVRVSIEPERGGEAATIDADIEPGQQVALLTSKSPLLPGRYLVRAEMKSRTGASVLQGSVVATVPVAQRWPARSALASRRGPGTGLTYQRTADPRFRRTERLQIEVPLLSARCETQRPTVDPNRPGDAADGHRERATRRDDKMGRGGRWIGAAR